MKKESGKMNRKIDELAKQRLIGIVMAGGSRAMAARYLHITVRTIYNAVKKDAEFARQLAEAEIFLTHLHRRAVQGVDNEVQNGCLRDLALEGRLRETRRELLQMVIERK